MSPQAVAQYVPKDGQGFDLCIIDEASQMPPEDAIGALYRSKQAMIVGDSQQLPPTNFFRQMIDDGEEDDAADPVTEESILEKAAGAFRPSRTLKWHYRSRHSGLIRFSNRIMYQDKLVVFPSSDEDRPGMGVSLVETGGLYKAGMNEIEAHAVVDAALRFMKENPDRSLGIVAVNKKQADFIREQLDYEIPRAAHASKFRERWSEQRDGLEEFFVKNLENVQGDERDVIFISTVYGPPSSGAKVMQRFGPINGEGGRRRLNVLFTRAKEQIRTFTSMTGADLTSTEQSNAGAWMLKRWLEYSAGMQFEVANDDAGGDFDSPFEEHVASTINAMGYTAVPQVGSSGFWIDIGVRHPQWPHGFVLGVECDGAAYHSSRSARDRDHYRQSVLEGLGWAIHRIWSTDWYQDPHRQADRLRNTIEARVSELKEGLKNRSGNKESFKVAEIELSKPTPVEANSSEVQPSKSPAQPPKQAALPFVEATISRTRTTPPLVPSSSKPKRLYVEIGDTVRIRYLDKADEVFQFRIVVEPSAPERGMVNKSAPLAQSVLDAEEDDTIEILMGSRIRKAVIEKVEKRQSQ